MYSYTHIIVPRKFHFIYASILYFSSIFTAEYQIRLACLFLKKKKTAGQIYQMKSFDMAEIAVRTSA